MSYGKNDGGAAYPSAFPELRDRHNNVIEEASNDFGMSLRDHFAGCALQGLCAVTGVDFGGSKGAAKVCYELADAMIAARNK